MVDLSLVLPVYNEEDIIEPVYKDIRNKLDRLGISYECILVENGSQDDSLKVCRKLAKKYKNTAVVVVRKGYGSAVIAGLKKAKGKYVSYMPSDGQINPKVFIKLWKLIKTGKYDVVKVKRVRRESLTRLVVSYIFSALVSIIFRTPFIDVNGTPRIFLRTKLDILDLQYKDSFIDVEFLVKTHYLGWKFIEVPIKILPRAGGVSTRSWRTFVEFFRNFWEFKTGPLISDWKQSFRI